MSTKASPLAQASPTTQEPSWFTQLCDAATENDVEGLTRLLSAHQPSIHGGLNQVDGGWGALHHAASKNSAEALRLLLNKGFDINHPLPVQSPLIIACRFKSPDCLEVLLKGGADLGFQASGGKNALDVLIERWGAKENAPGDAMRCLHLLLNAGMTTASTRDEGFGVFHACAALGLAQPLAVLLTAKDAKANMDAFDRDESGPQTPLALAFKNDRPDCVDLLLGAGCDPHLPNDLGVCAFDWTWENSASMLLYRSRLALASAKQALASAMDEAAPHHPVGLKT